MYSSGLQIAFVKAPAVVPNTLIEVGSNFLPEIYVASDPIVLKTLETIALSSAVHSDCDWTQRAPPQFLYPAGQFPQQTGPTPS